jgi:DNA-binding NarL/FixJ family response regulator
MRILLADDQAQVLSALRLLLEQETELDVIGETGRAQDLLVQAEIAQPDLVLLDWELPGSLAADLLSALRARCVQVKVVALSGRPEARLEALAAGIDAFVSKGDPPEYLLTAVHTFAEENTADSLRI